MFCLNSRRGIGTDLYGSFNRARDDFTQQLDRSTPFKVAGFVDMANVIFGDPSVTTADHDGVAVLVRAKE